MSSDRYHFYQCTSTSRLVVTASVVRLMVCMARTRAVLHVPPSAEAAAPRHAEEHGEITSMTSEVSLRCVV